MKTTISKRTKKQIGDDFNQLIESRDFIEDLASSHLEAWKDRYCNYGGNKKRLIDDLYINHDDSLEIEHAEEKLNRELTADENILLCKKFHDKVVELWENGDCY